MLSRQSQSFLDEVKRTRNWKTHLAYQNDLNQFESWLAARRLTVQSASDSSVRQYLEHFQKIHGRTMWSTHRAATTIRQLYRFLGRPLPKGIFKVQRPEGGLSSTRRALKPTQIDRLFSKIGADTPTARRDRAALILIYGLGFVVKDIIDLNLDQIELKHELIHPFGKSGNRNMTPRVLPLGGEVLGALNEWLGPTGRASFELNVGARMDRRAVFVGVKGTRLTRQGLTHILKNHAEAARLDPKISPIWLRDSFTKHMKTSGADPEDIDLINGSIAFVGTARNTRDYVNHARAVLRAHHPYWA